MALESPGIDPSQTFCPKCGRAMGTVDRFCPGCASELPRGPDQLGSQPGGDAPDRRYAGFWIRFVAFLIDYSVAPMGGALIVGLGFWLVTQGDEVTDWRAAAFGVSWYFGLVLFPFVYLVVMTRIWGQTLGKMALGIIVVDANGDIPSIARLIISPNPPKR